MGRIGYIDSLKGVAIILVILGHLIQYAYYPDNFDDNLLFRYIYSFHMPFFMILSGFTVKTNQQKSNDLYIKILSRFINLIIPFVMWAIIKYYLFDGPSLWTVLIAPMNGLWFLYALFFIYSIFIISIYFMRHLSIIKQSIFFICIFILLKLASSKCHKYGLDLVSTHFIYFCIGYILSIFKDKIITNKSIWLLWISIPLFFVLGVFWHRKGHHSIEFDIPLLNSMFDSMPYRLVIVLFATFSLFLIFFKFEWIFKRIRLEKLGKITLGIYAIHQIFIQLSFYMPAITKDYLHHHLPGQILMFCLVLSLSVLSVYFIQRYKIPTFLLLGKHRQGSLFFLTRNRKK